MSEDFRRWRCLCCTLGLPKGSSCLVCSATTLAFWASRSFSSTAMSLSWVERRAPSERQGFALVGGLESKQEYYQLEQAAECEIREGGGPPRSPMPPRLEEGSARGSVRKAPSQPPLSGIGPCEPYELVRWQSKTLLDAPFRLSPSSQAAVVV